MSDIDRAKRIAAIARTIPKEWTDSENWTADELRQVQGLIQCRYRVNGKPPVDRVYIVETMNAVLTDESLTRAGISDANNANLISVCSTWGYDFPEVGDEKQATRILELAADPVDHVNVLATYRHGKNERDDTPFVFADWVGHSKPPTATTGRTSATDEDIEAAAAIVDTDFTEHIAKSHLATMFDVDPRTLNRRIQGGEIRVHPGTTKRAKKIRIHIDDLPKQYKRQSERKRIVSESRKPTAN